MIKSRLQNINAFIITDIAEKDVLVNECMKKNKESFKKKMIYMDCLGDHMTLANDFFSRGYTTEMIKDKSNGLTLTTVDNSKELMSKIDFAVREKGAKTVFLNFPDTIISDLPNKPDDYDFLSTLMYMIILDPETFKEIKFYVSVFRTELTAEEFLLEEYKYE
jgi:hypothetical protein